MKNIIIAIALTLISIKPLQVISSADTNVIMLGAVMLVGVPVYYVMSEYQLLKEGEVHE